MIYLEVQANGNYLMRLLSGFIMWVAVKELKSSYYSKENIVRPYDLMVT